MRGLGVLLLVLLVNVDCSAQAVDSVKVYEDLRQFAYKRKVTKWLYQLVFVDRPIDLTPPGPPPAIPQLRKKTDDPYKSVEGKIIRSIDITSLDPFGKSVQDTAAIELNLLKKSANRYHIATRKNILNNRLLLKKNEPLEPLKVKESERLLRTLPYLRDARIIIIPTAKNSDSVDVKIITQDRWTLNGYTTFKPFKTNLGISETNFLGAGHGLRGSVTYNLPSLRYSLSSSYSIASIGKTYIAMNSSFVMNPGVKTYNLLFDRPVYSAYTKWGGGIAYLRNSSDMFLATDTACKFHLNNIDPWIGRAFKIKQRPSAKTLYRFIVSSRVNYTFSEQYGELPRSVHPAARSTVLYLGSLAVTTQSYYKDRNIFRFGEHEDIPEGQTFALIGGLETRNGITLPYGGAKLSHAAHTEGFGYWAAELEPGSFFRSGKPYKSTINLYTMYFTSTKNIGSWMIRQFVDYNLVVGLNREKAESIFLTGGFGIPGYKSYTISGQSKMIATFKTMCYVPYRFLGFGFAFFSFASFGNVGPQPMDLLRARVNQGYGMGINIRNDHLIVNTISLSFGYYPRAPEKDFLFNGVSVNENRFKSYYYAKPSLAPFQ